MGPAERALAFVHGGGKAETASELGASFAELIAAFGISYYCLGEIYAAHMRNRRGHVWSAASEHPWFRHWTHRDYRHVDPVVWYMRRQQSEVRWSHVRALSHIPRVDIFDEANEFGLAEGVSFGMGLTRERIAVLCLAHGARDAVAPEAEAPLKLASVYFATRIAHMGEFKPPKTQALTGREQEVLRFLALGRRDGAIGEALGISETTARQHTANAMRKLRAATRPQAIAIALTTGQIRL